MVTATLSDGTTTITFHNFREVNRRLEAENFVRFAYPDNEGAEVIFEGQWFRVFRFRFQLKNDASFPTSGDSAADKRADLETLLLNGGVNEWLFTVTFDSEDSTPGSPQTENYDGKVKLCQMVTKGGENSVVIEGDLEFWESI